MATVDMAVDCGEDTLTDTVGTDMADTADTALLLLLPVVLLLLPLLLLLLMMLLLPLAVPAAAIARHAVSERPLALFSHALPASL